MESEDNNNKHVKLSRTVSFSAAAMQKHSHREKPPGYFTEFTYKKGVIYLIAAIYYIATFVVILYEPFLGICEKFEQNHGDGTNYGFGNPAYVDDPCRFTRSFKLLGLTPQECMFGRRIVISVVLGGVIGWERRSADRPAGIRTMALVALGSCLFSICSAFAFVDGPNYWDASRISAAIPAGVGFLGAGLIWKDSHRDSESGETSQTVHGLTTAASLWLSAAVGIACGGGLYFPASFCTAIMLLLLRFGPRNSEEVVEDHEPEPVSPPMSEASPLVPKQTEDVEIGSLVSHDTVTNTPRQSQRRRVSARASFHA